MPTPEPFHVRDRHGRVVDFDPARITAALSAAVRAEYGDSLPETLDLAHLTQRVRGEAAFLARRDQGVVDVERLQDLVETALMAAGAFRVARRYIVYREQRARARAVRDGGAAPAATRLHVVGPAGERTTLDRHTLKARLYRACQGLADCDPGGLLDDLTAGLYDGITRDELDRALVLAARQRIERDPAYGHAAVRLVLDTVYREALGIDPDHSAPFAWDQGRAPLFDSSPGVADPFVACYRAGLRTALEVGVAAERLDPRLLDFDLDALAQALDPARDEDFTYLGVQTLYDRYLLHIEERRFETPQYFWMRVAMGLALEEDDPTARAVEFYGMLSTFRFVSATPTLFNAGTLHPQLSSCYLTTVDDDLEHIFKCVQDNALLSKWAGGLGNDWTRVRATGAQIQGTHGASQGVVPFLKVANDTALAVNQGGKRKGAVCAYLETWHLDLEAFLDLRKNTGDDRRRTHDMHTAHWIPDLFMQRVQRGEAWTLFSPDEVPDLHDLYGEAFAQRYEAYEAAADRGELRQHRRLDAAELWRKMLTMVYETGHPWLTFKDPANLRSPQDHAGVIHNSNLCTEILLNTSNDETAVCNLGSVNLKAHLGPKGVDHTRLAQTVGTAVRMLDNVIELNFYPTAEARQANLRHRPIGLGLMGFQDALYALRMAYDAPEAIALADTLGETISFHALQASAGLAAERGHYGSYPGSKWDRGLLPIDTVQLLNEARGGELEMDTTASLDWTPVREAIARHGLRNSNVMAIAPTATISNIAGCTQSIEPTYRNLYAKSNLSGDFTVVNEFLVNDLKQRDLWDEAMIEALKYHDGELGPIDRVPHDLKQLYRTAFELDADALIEATSRRQKWIDMGISFNLYLAKPSGRALSEMYLRCWKKGLKTTYYLRSQAATQIEKSSVDVNRHGAQPKWMKSASASATVGPASVVGKACSILEPDCEACQ